MREFVKAPRYCERVRQWGENIVKAYAANPARCRFSGGRGAEKDPVRQARSKAGEVAVAILCGLDPDVAVDWSLDGADEGWDVRMPGGTLLDVKTTLPGRKLIWSRDINHLYEAKPFFALVAVSCDPLDYALCWVEGWVTKLEFSKRKRIADGANGLEPGTWWMNKSELRPIRRLIEIDREIAQWRRAA